MTSKAQLRLQIRKSLAQLSNSVVQAESIIRAYCLYFVNSFVRLRLSVGELVSRKLLALAEYQQARSISVYLSMEKEIQTSQLLRKMLKDKKHIYIPRCTKDEMHMLRLHSWQDFQSLPRNAWNIPEPLPDDDEREVAFGSKENALDLIIMPGLCFNEAGVRLGHGKGYYDKFLASVFQKCDLWHIKRPRTVALSLSSQFINTECIPSDDFDIRPDLILRP